jgi:cell division protein FtsW
MYLWIFFRSITIFRRCGTAFPSMLVLGLGLMIVLQAIVNMMVSVGLMPVTGQTLPLVSRGGSSMLFNALALGMMLGVSRQMNERTLDKPKGESLLER